MVLVMILIQDIHLLVIETDEHCETDASSTKSSASDHEDNCDASCPSVIHVLENASNQLQIQNTVFVSCTSIWIGQEQKPENIIVESIDRPPEA